PTGALIADGNGVFYGTTRAGGGGWGTIFSLAPPSSPGGNWSETILYRFGAFPAIGGLQPESGVIMDASGVLYGTASHGAGLFDKATHKAGLFYKLPPPLSPGGSWTQSVLHLFTNNADGCWPIGGLIADRTGQLFGTTADCGTGGSGTVFRLTPPAVA